MDSSSIGHQPPTMLTDVTACLPADIKVISVRNGVFGGTVTLAHHHASSSSSSSPPPPPPSSPSSSTSSFKKKELWSALQKGVRRQDWRLAVQAVGAYALLAQGHKASVSWLFNRLPVIAKEDCANTYGAFHHAHELYERYKAGQAVPLADVLRVVVFLCSHGTSRLPSHMRALHGTVPARDPVRALMSALRACDPTQPDAVGGVTALVGAVHQANELYQALEAYVQQQRAAGRMPAAQAKAALRLIGFTRSLKGNKVAKSTKAGPVRDGDHDFLLRECVRFCLWPPATDVAPLAPLPDLSQVDFARPLPEFVFDQHVARDMKTEAGLRYFGAVASATHAVVFTDHPGYDQRAHRAYLQAKGVADPEAIEHALAFARGEATSLSMAHLVLGPQPPNHDDDDDDDGDDVGDDDGKAAEEEEGTEPPKRRQCCGPRLPDPVVVGGHTVWPYLDEARQCARFTHGCFQGTKAPTLAGDTLFFKLCQSDEQAEYAMWAFEALRALGLPAPPTVRIEHWQLAADALLPLVDLGGGRQREAWERHYVGSVPVLVTTKLASFRQVTPEDLANPAVCRQFVKVLLARRVVLQSSDLCTNNLRVAADGQVYSIDHNRKAEGPVEFIGRRFSAALASAVRAELRANAAVYRAFVAECRAKFPEHADMAFRL